MDILHCTLAKIFTMEPTHVKAILATQFNDFEKGPFQYQQWHTLLGSGVFNSDGETWKYAFLFSPAPYMYAYSISDRFHRAMTRPFFNKDRVTDYDIFDRHAVRVISRMKSRLEENQAVDVQDAFGRFTLDSASEFLFGKDVQSIGAGLPYSPASGIPNPASFTNHPSTKFVKAFMKAQGKTLSRSRTGKLWPLYEFWKDLVMPERDVLDSFLIPVLLDARDRKKGRLHEGTNDAQNHQTLLDHLRHCDYIHLCKTSATLFRTALINTAASARPFDTRSSKQDTTLPNAGGKPYFIPANTTIVYGAFLIHRRTDLWGPDEFDPDRFLDSRLHKYLNPNPFIFIPFNAGPRICLGQQFAYNEASIFLIRLLQVFSRFTPDCEAQAESDKPPRTWKPNQVTTKGRDKIMFRSHFTLCAKGGLWVRMS
ncbi:cytochrome p450 monooxygenase pc-3 [Moniliophthora roreri]|nr:cytochrome p450 monooxygenase pc-3 [Moniliophthora roreri]